jgi:hypothetical protein
MKAANAILKVLKQPICQCQTDCLIGSAGTVQAANAYLYPALKSTRYFTLCRGKRN